MHRRVRRVRSPGMAAKASEAIHWRSVDQGRPKAVSAKPCNVIAATTWAKGMPAQAGGIRLAGR